MPIKKGKTTDFLDFIPPTALPNIPAALLANLPVSFLFEVCILLFAAIVLTYPGKIP